MSHNNQNHQYTTFNAKEIETLLCLVTLYTGKHSQRFELTRHFTSFQLGIQLKEAIALRAFAVFHPRPTTTKDRLHSRNNICCRRSSNERSDTARTQHSAGKLKRNKTHASSGGDRAHVILGF